MKNRRKSRSARKNTGFTLIEVLISIAVLTVGLVGLLGVMGMAMAATQSSEQVNIAKRLANEALESILTARETANVDWVQIANGNCNVGDSCGIFLTGAQPIDLPGVDGIVGTNDDGAAGPQILDMPGPSGIVMTTPGNPCAAPDVCQSLGNYTRTIAIAPFGTDTNLNSVTITVTYTTTQFKVAQNYVLSTLISQYR
ncbi:MAG TPA: prepilin-type N-terminal cleavage/methylation domain-containing protein [Terriglobales bacterium]|jgi:prepilin-type N-terminal cleavage/methylation domain-containing protein